MHEYHMIIGKLGNEPEMRYLPDGRGVTSFSVRTYRSWIDKGSGERVYRTKWWNMSVFGPQADSCYKYLQKGSLVAVEFEMNAEEDGNPRAWSNAEGEAKARFEGVARNVRFLDGKDGPTPGNEPDSVEDEDNTRPF